ncbi:hypothetical protein HN011_003414 [Eciton burchellii]|nr:hypothetical protein HN011_003414 [Eciton burchellii]
MSRSELMEGNCKPVHIHTIQKWRVEKLKVVHAIFNLDTASIRCHRSARSHVHVAMIQKRKYTSEYLPSSKDTPWHRSVPLNLHKSLARHTNGRTSTKYRTPRTNYPHTQPARNRLSAVTYAAAASPSRISLRPTRASSGKCG